MRYLTLAVWPFASSMPRLSYYLCSREQGEQSPKTDIRLRLVCESAESHGAWIVAMRWLENDCEGPPPRGDARMYPGGIPPRALSSFEWARISSNYGMLDLPFSKLSKLIHILQEKRTLGVTQAFSREYLLYATFCAEQYAYQTAASDLEQRLSGIEHAIEACDGLNFKQTMEQLCLIGYGKINSLPFRQQIEFYEREAEFVALRLLQAALGAFVCLRLEAKGKGPKHWFWKQHRGIYRIAVTRCRDQRIRTLAVLMKLVRRQRPAVKLVEYLQREQELESRHRDFQKEQETIKEQKRLDALPRAERRKELARIDHEKREVAEAELKALGLTKKTGAGGDYEGETVANPLAGHFTTPEKPEAPDRPPLPVVIPGQEDETPMTEKERKAAEKAAKKERKTAEKAAKKKAEKEAKKKGGKKDQGGSIDFDTVPAVPVAAPRPGEDLEVEGITSLASGNAHSAAMAMLSGDQDDLSMLDDLESMGDGLGDQLATSPGHTQVAAGDVDEV